VLSAQTLYPRVVPAGYLRSLPEYPEGFVHALGHEVHVVLVEDLGGLYGNVTPQQLEQAGLDPFQAHNLALENLVRLVRRREVSARMYRTPQQRPFVLWQGHALTASCIRLPNLFRLARRQLGTDGIAAAIPHSETMLLFPLGDRAFRGEMRERIRKNEHHEQRLITFEFFSLNADGVSALLEE
jgi:hypothetical protein